VPSQESVWRDDAGKAPQSFATNGLGFKCQASPLVIVEPGTPSQLFLQNAHFLRKVCDDPLLVSLHPTAVKTIEVTVE